MEEQMGRGRLVPWFPWKKRRQSTNGEECHKFVDVDGYYTITL